MKHDDLSIQTPCPKSWSSLEGDGGKRFCGECRLHVHSSDAMTRAEARALVAGSSERVCMRLVLDDAGGARYKDSQPASVQRMVGRLAGLALAAGMLSACREQAQPEATCGPDPASGPPKVEPGGQGGVDTKPPEIMGAVCAPEIMGEVAAPEIMGKVAAPEVMGDVMPAPLDPEAPHGASGTVKR